MKKLNKNKNNRSFKRLLILVIAIIAVIGAIIYSALWIKVYSDGAKQASATQVANLVVLGARGLKKDAPVDARTGDVYFPESRLYLPRPESMLALTYMHDTGNITNAQSELSVSTNPLWGTTQVYAASNQKMLFETIPKLQACARGIKVVSQKFDSSDTTNELRQTVQINGQPRYIYVEKACPELNELADQFKNLRAY